MTSTFSPSAVRGIAPGRARRTLTRSRRAQLWALAFVAPAWIAMLVVGIIPIAYAVWMSFTDHSLGSVEHPFIGLRNYAIGVFTPAFLESLGVTAFLSIVGLIVQLVVGYLLGTLLHRQLRGFKFARTILLIPMLLTPIVVGLMWQFILNPDLGAITLLGDTLGVTINVFADPDLARLAIITIDSWMHIPFVMLMVSAGMAGLDEEQIEAAQIDGAGWWQRTFHVVLPQLRPVLTLALLVRFVDNVRQFDIIYATTRGGPGHSTQNTTMLSYLTTYQYYEFGQGAAMAVALAVILVPVYFIYVRLTKI